MDLSGHDNLRIAPSAALMDRPMPKAGPVLFGALLVSAAVAALPASLMEVAIASLGLGEVLPSLTPPLGWAPRLMLALSAGMLTAAMLLIFGRLSQDDGSAPAQKKRTDRMTLAASFGWQRLASFARGSATSSVRHENRDTHEMKWRRADLHPDAPPPVPLFASRDLPLGGFDAVVDNSPAPEPRLAPVTERQPPFRSADFDPARPPVRDLSRHDRPRPLPRSPEPLSEEEVEALRGLLRAIPEPAPPPSLTVAADGEPRSAVAVDSDVPLTALLGRFEKSVEERIALAHAQDAAARLDQTLSRSDDPISAERQAPEAETVEDALRDALAALRDLSVSKRGSGKRR